MAEENGTARDILMFQLSTKLINHTKTCLIVLEDLQANGVNISPDQFSHARKRMLDSGGSALRNLETFLDKLDINFKI